MKCPYCGAEESKVIDSRPTEDNERIRRRRECLNCHMRFTTYEVVETVPLVVIKKDNSREPFDRQKLFNAMLRACAKRPVSYETLERAVSSIEQSLFSSYDREIPSVRIGELTMEELKKKGMWFVCADMDGTRMYDLNLTGSIGLVIGNEGEGVGRLVKENCDFIASIPMKGNIDSLNASVAAGVLAYEIVRQRLL